MKEKNKNNILDLGENFYKKNSIKSDYFTEYKGLYNCYNKWSYKRGIK